MSMAEQLPFGKFVYGLLSDFYTLIWGDLDNFLDDHRWVRLVTDKEPSRSTESLIRILSRVSPSLPIPIVEIEADLGRANRLSSEWRRSDPEERRNIRISLDEMMEEFQTKALKFASLAFRAAFRAVTVVIFFRMEPGRAREAVSAVSRVGGIRVAHVVSGPFDAFAIAEATDYTMLEAIISELRKIDGVKDVESYLALES